MPRAACGLTASAPASAHTVARAADPTLTIIKSLVSVVNTSAGRQITYKYTVANRTASRFFNVSVGDIRIVGGVRSQVPVCTLVTGSVPFLPGTSMVCMASIVTSQRVQNTGAALVRGTANALSNTVPVPVPVTG